MQAVGGGAPSMLHVHSAAAAAAAGDAGGASGSVHSSSSSGGAVPLSGPAASASAAGGVGIGVGQLLLRLAHMHEMLMRRPQKSSMEHWRLFVAEFFHETAQFRYLVTLANQQHRVFMMGAETLPRLFHVIYNSGIAQQSIELSDPREYAGADGTYTLSAREARWRMESDTADAIVELHGTFKIGFVPVPPSSTAAPVTATGASLRPRHSLKIVFWEFDRQYQREYFAPTSRNQATLNASAAAHQQQQQQQQQQLHQQQQPAGSSPVDANSRPRLVNEYGLPPLVMRCFEIADILLYMNDLMRFYVRHQIASPQETLERYYNEFLRPQMSAPGTSNAMSASSNIQTAGHPSGSYSVGIGSGVFHEENSAGDMSGAGSASPADNNIQRRTSGRKRKRTDTSFTSFDDDDDDDERDDETETQLKRRTKKAAPKPTAPEPDAMVDGDAPSPSGRGRGRKKTNPDPKRSAKPRATDDAEYSAPDEFDDS